MFKQPTVDRCRNLKKSQINFQTSNNTPASIFSNTHTLTTMNLNKLKIQFAQKIVVKSLQEFFLKKKVEI